MSVSEPPVCEEDTTKLVGLAKRGAFSDSSEEESGFEVFNLGVSGKQSPKLQQK